MPCTPDAVQVLRKANILVAPAMAAGAGGVRCLLNISCVNYTYILTSTKTNINWLRCEILYLQF
jgi:glutamate dehydrogenase/leucine dehydrogenase